jgi:hypothetical protein
MSSTARFISIPQINAQLNEINHILKFGRFVSYKFFTGSAENVKGNGEESADKYIFKNFIITSY